MRNSKGELYGDKYGTFLDNQVHIAHNVKIGKNCIITAQVGIAGSSSIGNKVRYKEVSFNFKARKFGESKSKLVKMLFLYSFHAINITLKRIFLRNS